MPRPPILPLIDWRVVFESGKDFESWLKTAENPEHRDRMQRIFSDLKLDVARESALKAIEKRVYVIAIAEDWCGDVVRFAPVVARMALASNEQMQLHFIARAQHPDVFIRFLTNGGEAIPKFIFLSDAFVECGNWGPMPSECRRIISRGKGSGQPEAARARVSKMYEADPDYETMTREILELIEIASCTRP